METTDRPEYKYYITLSPDDTILESFSTAFKKPTKNDTLVGSGKNRHYNLSLQNFEGEYNLVYKDGVIRDKTEAEIDTVDYRKRKAIQQLQASDKEILRGVDDIVSWVWAILEELDIQDIKINTKLNDKIKTKLVEREALRLTLRR